VISFAAMLLMTALRLVENDSSNSFRSGSPSWVLRSGKRNCSVADRLISEPLRSGVFNIDQEFFSKMWIFSSIFTAEAIGGEAEQQMHHLLQNTNSGDHLKEMPRSLRDLSIQRARSLLTWAA
jgi:hypothetical protein